MKRILMAVVAAAVLPALAWEKVATVQVTDTVGLMQAVTKLGDMTGNQAIGVLAAAELSKMPCSSFFGAMRPGSSMVLPIFVDEEDESGEEVEFSVVYPVSLSKEQFLAMHSDAVAVGDDCWKVKGLPLEMKSKHGDTSFVKFSADGRWAIASDSLEQVLMSVDEIESAKRPMDSDLVRIALLPNFFKLLRTEAAKELANERSSASPDKETIEGLEIVKAFADNVDAFWVALRVSDLGIELRGGARTLEGTKFAQRFDAAETFGTGAMRGGDALVSYVTLAPADAAANFERAWDAVVTSYTEQKFPISLFVKTDIADHGGKFTFDIVKMAKWCETHEDELEDFDVDKAVQDVVRMVGNQPVSDLPYRPYALSLAFAGYQPKYSAAARLTKVIPEADGRALVGAYSFSLTGLAQAILHVALEVADEDGKMTIATLAPLLPPECEGGVAAIAWRDGRNLRYIVRISADEVKAIGTSAAAIAVFGETGVPPVAMPAAVDADDDDDGDDDSGDDTIDWND